MIGELAALSAALSWAVASILFAQLGIHLRAINLNLIKGLIAGGIMLGVLSVGSLTAGWSADLDTVRSIPMAKLALLLASGAIGIGLGDSAYFGCLRRIGPQKGLMLEAIAPIIAAVMALLWFNEMLAAGAWIGILLTSAGTVLVIRFSISTGLYRNSLGGIGLGLMAAGAQAAGIVLSRMALADGGVNALASSLVRLIAGLTALFCWAWLRRIHQPAETDQTLMNAFRLLFQKGLLLKTAGAVTIGTVLALWLQQISVAHTSAGVAQTLLAACPLFGMIIGVIQGQRQPAAVWGGLFLGILGIGLLFLR